MRTLLITVDSLRYDTFSEHMDSTKKNLDWIHEDTYSTGPNTGEAFPAIIGGLYPRKVGLPTGTSVAHEFDAYTAGISTNHLLSPKYGYDEGFDRFTSPAGGGGGVKDRAARFVTQGSLMYRMGATIWNLIESVVPTKFRPSFQPAAAVINEFEKIQHEHDEWFVWMHFMEPHHPYEPPTAEDRLHARQLSRSVIAGSETGEQEREQVRAYYRGEVRSLDRELERVWDLLADDTRVLFCADHGELLGEEDLWGHVGSFKSELLHVPLGGKNLTQPDDLASLIDVPSILTSQEHNQGTLSRDVAFATDGREWAAIDGIDIATPEGVFNLETREVTTNSRLQRAQASFEVKTGALEQADVKDLEALGYL